MGERDRPGKSWLNLALRAAGTAGLTLLLFYLELTWIHFHTLRLAERSSLPVGWPLAHVFSFSAILWQTLPFYALAIFFTCMVIGALKWTVAARWICPLIGALFTWYLVGEIFRAYRLVFVEKVTTLERLTAGGPGYAANIVYILSVLGLSALGAYLGVRYRKKYERAEHDPS